MERATQLLSAAISRLRRGWAFIATIQPRTHDRTPGVMIAILYCSRKATGPKRLSKWPRSRFSARAVTIRSENAIRWFDPISNLTGGNSEKYRTWILPSRFKISRLKRKNENCGPVILSNFSFSFWTLKPVHTVEENGCGYEFFEKNLKGLPGNLIMPPSPKAHFKPGRSFSFLKIKSSQFTNKPLP